jgi:hypothetical protein
MTMRESGATAMTSMLATRDFVRAVRLARCLVFWGFFGRRDFATAPTFTRPLASWPVHQVYPAVLESPPGLLGSACSARRRTVRQSESTPSTRARASASFANAVAK